MNEGLLKSIARSLTVIAVVLAFWVFYNVGADAYAVYQVKQVEWKVDAAFEQRKYDDCVAMQLRTGAWTAEQAENYCRTGSPNGR